MNEGTNGDWGNLRIRRARMEGNSDPDRRFWLGVKLLFVGALVFPWYSYWVNAFLFKRDMEAAAVEMKKQMVVSEQQMNEEVAAAQYRAEQAAGEQLRQSAAMAMRDRIAMVKVMGASTNSGNPIVLVVLGNSNAYEAASTICTQSARWVGASVSGKQLQVQAYRGTQPAITVGTIRCP